MANNFSYRGPIAPVFTPFNDDEEKSLNLDIIPNYAKYLLDHGIKGILVNGTSGEGPSLNIEQRKSLAEAWINAASSQTTKLHIMIQVGGAALPDVLEMALHAEKIGANSLLCLPELYFKPTNIEQLISHLKLVANAASKTPLLYYHIPAFTNVNIHMGEFLKAIDGKVSNFAGIKFTSEAIDEGLEAVKACGGKYAVFLGADTLMLKAYSLGFDSAIATTFNIFPKLGMTIYDYYKMGKLEEVTPVQAKLSAAVSVITKHGGWVPTMKVAMNLFTVIYVGPVRDPIIPLTKKQSQEINNDITLLKIIK